MERSRKVKIVMSLLLVLSLISLSIIYYFKTPSKQKDENVLGQQDSLNSVPRIISLAPTVAYEGEEYVYDIKYTDNDSSVYAISYELVNGPSWLKLLKGRVVGTPPTGSAGSYRFDVRISDGKNSSVQESYILVEVKNE
ncbi:MAG: Ig domain-containing protein [Candidatus Dojkabacteria bacterium]|nr:Ig domain-containing protein [Candidatus Dojkabacteria bacterium]